MDSEHSLDRVIDTLATRFPHLDQQVVAETVYSVHARLSAHATVTAHLAALTQCQAAYALRRVRPAGR